MINLDLNLLRNFAVIFAFTILFGTAAGDKFKSLKTPEWFIKQFENTFISKLPGGAAFGYWQIAVFEGLLTLAFFASFFIPALLPIALTGALFLFGALLLGLRLASDFQGSANMFVYITASLVSLYLVQLN